MSDVMELGVTVLYGPPVLGTVKAETWGDLTPNISSYTHTNAAMGGYTTARAALSVSQIEIEEWIENGLGRDITAYNHGGEVRWNGFVNSITATLNGLTYTYGPLLAIGNRASVMYSTVDTSTTPPTVGLRAQTALANDTASQSRYGIFEVVLSTGGATAATAASLRDTYLTENAKPIANKDLQSGANGCTLSLDCLGYSEFLKLYPYSNTTSGTTTASVRVAAVVAADPNAVLSTSTALITTNTLSVNSYTNDAKMALDYIYGICAMGDASYNRWLFGIGAERVPYYKAMPAYTEYLYTLTDGASLRTPGGAGVHSWDILPGKAIFIDDFMAGRNIDYADIYDDPRNIFIESVTYTAPTQWNIKGSRRSRIKQMLAQLGLSGIGA